MDEYDEKLSRILHEETDAYIKDDGFSLRVMQALPPRKAHPFRKRFLVGMAALGGCAAFAAANAGSLRWNPVWTTELTALFAGIGKDAASTMICLGISLAFSGITALLVASRCTREC